MNLFCTLNKKSGVVSEWYNTTDDLGTFIDKFRPFASPYILVFVIGKRIWIYDHEFCVVYEVPEIPDWCKDL